MTANTTIRDPITPLKTIEMRIKVWRNSSKDKHISHSGSPIYVQEWGDKTVHLDIDVAPVKENLGDAGIIEENAPLRPSDGQLVT